MNPEPKRPIWKRVPYRDLTARDAWTWLTNLEVYPNGTANRPPEADLVISALLNLLDAARENGGRVLNTERLLIQIRDRLLELAKEVKPTPVRSPAERAHREALSRARAWLTYKKAGGAMTLDEADVVPPGPETPVDELRFSVRVRRALMRLKVETVEQLTALTEDDLAFQRNFGSTSLREVRNKLKALGLALRAEREGT